MTFAAIQGTGSGEVSWRLKIERWPESWVTHPSMVNAASAVKRYAGLSVRGGKIKHVTNPVTSESEVSALGVGIVDLEGRATLAFSKRPALKTWLTVDLTPAATTATVRSTSGWPTSGTFWIDSETITYTNTTATTFTGLTRGALDSIAQQHYTTTGGGTRFPEVTDRPVTMAGARAWLYIYGRHDDPQGDGTLFWTGIVSRDPSYMTGAWQLSIEPLTSALDRSVASDLAAPVRPRGIYYNAQNPFGLNVSDEAGNVYTFSFPSTAGDTAFFESNADFIIHLNSKIAASNLETATGTKLWAVADGEDSWHLEAETTVTAHTIYIGSTSAIDPQFDGPGTLEPRYAGIGNLPEPFFGANTHYYYYPNPTTSVSGAGSVPRGFYGIGVRVRAVYQSLLGTFSPFRLYLSGGVDVSGLTSAMISWKSVGPWVEADHSTGVTTVDALAGYVDTTGIRDLGVQANARAHGYTSAALPEIRFGRLFSDRGSLGDFLSAVIALNPVGLNLGSVPALRTSDFEVLPNIFPTVRDRIVQSRVYRSFGEADLIDTVKGECLLAGHAVGLTWNGLIKFFEIKPPVSDPLADATLQLPSPVVSSGAPSYEPQSRGVVNQLVVKRGYNPLEDSYDGRDVIVRDVAAFGQSPRPRSIVIEPKSQTSGELEGYAEIVALAAKLFSLFAHPYASVRVDADPTFLDVEHGDVIYVTSRHVPDTNAGTMGVTSLPVLVVGREVELSSLRVTLYGIATNSTAAGYCPEFFITAETNTSGNTWSLDLDIGSELVSRHFAAGYKVRVWRWNSTSAGVVQGTVSSVTDSNTLVVDFTSSAAAITTGTWILGWTDATFAGAPDDQLLHAYLATSNGKIQAFSGDIRAREFG